MTSSTHHLIFCLWIIMAAAASGCLGINVKKCCEFNELLDAETLKCVPGSAIPPERMTHFLPSYMLDDESNLITMRLKANKDILAGQMVTHCQRMELLDLTKPLSYLISTQAKLISIAGKFRPNEDLGPFCIDTAFLKSNLTFRAALICDPCQKRPCVQSCCSHLQMAKIDSSSGKMTCQNPLESSGSGFKAAKLPKTLENLTFIKSDDNRYSDCERKNGTMLLTEDFQIVNQGRSTVVNSGMNRSSDFCLAFTAMESEGQNMVELCVTDEQAIRIALFTKTYPICCTVSNFFLLLTFIAYVLIPSLRSPLFGKIIMIFIFCLFLAYSSISIVSFGHSKLVNHRPEGLSYSPICRVLGFVLQFTYLQAFFWMNVLSYDIFRAFRKVRLTSVASKERDDIRKLLFYTMYASGAPMIIIILSVVVEYQPSTYSGPRPQFGVHRCFFGNDLGSFIFFHLPLLVIQTANLVFFILTAKKLYETWRLTKENLDSNEYRISPRAQKNCNNFKVIVKIFVIMGVTWFSELFGFILSWIYGRDKVWKYFVVNDIINLLQGVLIFVVLVCKPSVMKQLWPKFSPKKKISVCSTKNTTLTAAQ